MAEESKNKLRQLYEWAKEDGYDTGSFSDFSANMNSSKGRHAIYDTLSKDSNYDLGTFEHFSSEMTKAGNAMPSNANYKKANQPVTDKNWRDVAKASGFDTSGTTLNANAPKIGPKSLMEAPAASNLGARNATHEENVEMDKNVKNAIAGRDVTFKSENPNYKVTPEEYATMKRDQALGVNYLTPEQEAEQARLEEERKRNEGMTDEERIQRELDDVNKRISKRNAELAEQWSKAQQGSAFGAGQYDPYSSDDELMQLRARQSMLDDAMRTLKAGKETHKSQGMWGGVFDFSNNWNNFWRGVGDTVTDAKFYQNGVADLNEAVQLGKIKNKIDNGEELSDEEASIGLAAGLRDQIQQEYGDELSHMYNAGTTTANMLPFMVQIAMNPAGGMGKTLGRAAVRKFGRTGAKAIAARVGGRIAGDAVSSIILANTLQGASTAAQALSNYNGDAQLTTDENGNLKFDGFKGGMSGAQAVANAITSATIENFTEEMGEWGMWTALGKKIGGTALGQAVSQRLSKLSLGNVTSYLFGAKPAEWTKGINDALRKAHWSGNVGEVMEEEYGILLNHLFGTSDATVLNPDGTRRKATTWEELTDIDGQIDIILGVGMFGGAVSAMNMTSPAIEKGWSATGGKAWNKAKYIYNYNKAKNDLKDRDRVASFRLTAPVWNDIKASTEGKEGQELVNAIKTACEGKYPQEARAILDYFHAQAYYNGFNTANELKKVDGTDANTADGKVNNIAESAMQAGASASTPEEIHNVGVSASVAEQNLNATPEGKKKAEALKRYFDDGITDVDNAQVAAIIDGDPNARAYFEGLCAHHGMQGAIDDKTDEAYQKESKFVSDGTDSAGNVTFASLNGQRVIITANDGQNVTYLTEDGKKDMCAIDALDVAEGADTPFNIYNAEQYLEDFEQGKYDEIAEQYTNSMHNNPKTITDIQNGTKLTFGGADGNANGQQYQVIGVNEQTGAFDVAPLVPQDVEGTIQYVPDLSNVAHMSQQEIIDAQNAFYDAPTIEQAQQTATNETETPTEQTTEEETPTEQTAPSNITEDEEGEPVFDNASEDEVADWYDTNLGSEGGQFIQQNLDLANQTLEAVKGEEPKEGKGAPKRKRGGFGALLNSKGKVNPNATAEEKAKEVQRLFDVEREKFLPQAKENSSYAKALADSKNVKEAVAKIVSVVKDCADEYKDWASRKYKSNNTVIEVGGKYEDLESTSRSIGSINEKRRQNRMKGAQEQARDAVTYAETLMQRCGIPKAEYKDYMPKDYKTFDELISEGATEAEKPVEVKQEGKVIAEGISELKELPKGVNVDWKTAKKYTDKGYKYTTVQIAEANGNIYIKVSGTYKENPVKSFYYEIKDWKDKAYNDVALAFVDKDLSTRHLEDAIRNFYHDNGMSLNGNGILKPISAPKDLTKKPATASGKLEDFGEQIAGARKDMLKQLAKNFDDVNIQSLIAQPLSKVFKKLDSAKLIKEGVIKEDEAIVIDAMNTLITMGVKPKAGTRRDRRYSWLGGKSLVEQWAEQKNDLIQELRKYIEGDETARANWLFDHQLADLDQYGLTDETRGKLNDVSYEQRRELLKKEDYRMEVDPIGVTLELMKRLGYQPNEKFTGRIPYIEKYYNEFKVSDYSGQGTYYKAFYKLSDALDWAEWAGKFNRGDSDVKTPIEYFRTKNTGSKRVTNGEYEVSWFTNTRSLSIRSEKFKTKEAADEYAEKLKTKGNKSVDVREDYDLVGTDYVLQVHDPLSGDMIRIDGKKFDTAADAKNYLAEHYDEVNDLINEQNAKVKGRETVKYPLVTINYTWGSDGSGYSLICDKIQAFFGSGGLIIKTFKTEKEARDYYNEHKEEIDKWCNDIIEKQRKFDFFAPDEPRRGEDYRKGKDVTPEQFTEAFGFRGVQFGNWTNGEDRQRALNEAYDGLMDLSKVTGLSPRALSLGGELGLAFGSRGSGSANAHYEPKEVVINLTKTSGAGSLAHEWLHAIDNYLGRSNGLPMGYVTDILDTPSMRPELREAINALVRATQNTNYAKRSKDRGAYWGRMIEIQARLFAEWADRKLQSMDNKNAFLTRGVPESHLDKYRNSNYLVYKSTMEGKVDRQGNPVKPLTYEEFIKTPAALKGCPYPTDAEIKQLSPYIEDFLHTLKEEVVDGKTILNSVPMIEVSPIAEENVTQEFKEYSSKIINDYNNSLPNHGYLHNCYSEADVNETCYKLGLSDKAKEGILKCYHGIATGLYIPSTNIIIVFPHKIGYNEMSLKSTVLHENVHYAEHFLDVEGKEALLKHCWEYIEANEDELAKHIKDKYEPKDYLKESIAYLIGNNVDAWDKFSDFISKFADPEIKTLVSQIYIQLHDETRRKENPIEASSLGLLGSSARDAERIGRTREEGRTLQEVNNDYLANVASGNTDKAQQLVTDAAAIAMPNTTIVDKDGKPKHMYHGTQLMEMYFKDGYPYVRWTERFNTFKGGKGFFTSDKADAETFTGGRKSGLYDCFLNIEHPFVFDCHGQDWDAIRDYRNGEVVSTDMIVYDIKNNHPEYDGVILKNVYNENSGAIKHSIDDVIPFSPNQIKSAETVTRDDNGEIIPLSKRFDLGNNDIRFRKTRVVSAEDDRKFMAAAKRGDTENAEKIVADAVAKAMPNTKVVDKDGKPLVVYHGTHSGGFSIFDPIGAFSWASPNRAFANSYTYDEGQIADYEAEGYKANNQVYPLYMNIENPLDMGNIEYTCDTPQFDAVAEKLGMSADELRDRFGLTVRDAIYELNYRNGFAELVASKGYDGVKCLECWDEEREYGVVKHPENAKVVTYGALNSSQIKSADPITYDDEGNVIPLSKRFDLGNDDVRFARAWHGSASDFDRFNLNFALTGEGSMVNGHGVYVGSLRGTGERYASIAADSNMPKTKVYTEDITLDGKTVRDFEYGSPEWNAMQAVARANLSIKRAIENAKDGIDWYNQIGRQDLADEEQKTLDVLESGRVKVNKEIKESTRYLYEVEIPDDNGSNYLDWDKELSKAEVQRIGNKVIDELIKDPESGWEEKDRKNLLRDYGFQDACSGGSLYGSIQDAFAHRDNPAKEASNFLHSLGYVGNKVPVGYNSDGKQVDNAYNYVIFNPDDVKIISKTAFRPAEVLNLHHSTAEMDAMEKEVRKLADELHVPVEVIRTYDEVEKILGVSTGNKEILKKEGKGIYNTADGKVYVFLPNNVDAKDARKTVLHEIVGHKGLRQLVGEKAYNAFLMKVYYSMPSDAQHILHYRQIHDFGGDLYEAVDEYLAEYAEADLTPTWWEKVKAALRQLLRSAGIDIDLNDNDVKYLIWQSKHQLTRGDIVTDAESRVMRKRLGINESAYSSTAHTDINGVRYRKVEDKATIEWFNKQPKTITYKTVDVQEDGMHAPMADNITPANSTAKANYTKTGNYSFGDVLEAEENPQKIVKHITRNVPMPDGTKKRVTYGKVNIIRGDGNPTEVAYDPYDHSSDMFINDQFKSAWERDTLRVIRQEIATSEIDGTDTYWADDAQLPTGKHEWKTGVVGQQLPPEDTRHVYMVRYSRPLGYVDWKEVADQWIDVCTRNNISVPFNVVPKAIRDIIADAGVNIVEPERIMGKNCFDAYEEWKAGRNNPSPNGGGNTPTKGGIRKRISDVFGTDNDMEKNIYTPMQYQNVVNKFKAVYNSKPIHVLTKKTTEADLKALGLGQKAIDDILKGLNSPRYAGFYDTVSDKIFIFAERSHSIKDIVSTLIHENLHGLVKDGVISQDFLNRFVSNAKAAQQNLYDTLEAAEDEDGNKIYTDDLNEEFFVSLAEYGMMNDKEHLVTRHLNEEDKKVFDNICNTLGYEQGVRRSSRILQEEEHSLSNNRVKTKEEQKGRFKIIDTLSDGTSIVEKQSGSARDQYERTLNNAGYKFQEISQDSMLGLKTLMNSVMKAEGKTFDDVADWENAYWAENHMSSVNQKEFEVYRRLVFKPILDAVKKLEDNGADYEDIKFYLFAKHGLERNEYMTNEKVEQALFDEFDEEESKAKKQLYKGAIGQEEYDAIMDDIRMRKADRRIELEGELKRDFSGLTALTGHDKEDSILEIEDDARKIVSEFEGKHDVNALWSAINKATQATLDKQLESGLMDKETHTRLSQRYKYYIPLRGFDETTSDEVYDYLQHSQSAMNDPIRKANGRLSLADDPIATIGNMAESGIMAGNRNLMKQKFLNFVENHRSDAVSVSDVHLFNQKDAQGNDNWIAIGPAYMKEAGITKHDATQKEFESWFAQQMSNEPERYAMGKDKPNVPYRTLKKFMGEHQVLVKRGGRQFVLTINGNPRAAQALNGLTNPDSLQDWTKAIATGTNIMARLNTTFSPAFIFANLSRDGIYANSLVWAKESPSYAMNFNKNWSISLAKVGGLVRKFNKGTLDMNKPIEKMFYEFMMNGGETGQTRLTNVEQYKGVMQDALDDMRRKPWSPKHVMSICGAGLELMNQWAEDTSRFAAYMTSRQQGRSIMRSVHDAKEISVNFNKKGAGSATAGIWEKGNRAHYLFGQMMQLARPWFMFFNAGVQGMANVGRIAKRNKGKFVSIASAYFGLGMIAPFIAAACGGDGDDDYWNLPEYIRRQNLCLYIGSGYVKIPLPIELRAIYGLGDVVMGQMLGKTHYSAGQLAENIGEQFCQILPIDFMGEGGMSLVPSVARPITEAFITNEDWTGMPIYKDYDYLDNAPNWTKAYSKTDPTIISLCEYLNEISGGNAHKKGTIDLNPAIIEHLYQGYLGGMGTFLGQNKRFWYDEVFGNEDIQSRNVPVFNRFYAHSDERMPHKRIDSEWYEYKDKMNAFAAELNGFKGELNSPDITKRAEALDNYRRLVTSDDYAKYLLWNAYYKTIDKLDDAQKETDSKELDDTIYSIKEQANEAMRK